MKKEPKGKMVTKTAAEIREWPQTKAGQEALARIDAIRDEDIDTSDIPEKTDWSRGTLRMYTHPETRQISIRLSVADLLAASKLASRKGMPYQTYLKSLLHEALEREAAALERESVESR